MEFLRPHDASCRFNPGLPVLLLPVVLPLLSLPSSSAAIVVVLLLDLETALPNLMTIELLSRPSATVYYIK